MGTNVLTLLFADLVFVRKEVFRLREVFEVVDAEVVHEFLAGAVEQGTAQAVGFSFDHDQALLQQFLNRIIAIHSPDLFQFCFGDRLLIGNDGQRFHLCRGEPLLGLVF